MNLSQYLSLPLPTSALGTPPPHPLPTLPLVPPVPSPTDFPYKYHRSRLLLPYQEEWSLHQERSSAIQAAHPPPYGLCVPSLEVRCPHTHQEAAGATIQVSSPCYGCPLVSLVTGRFTRIWVFLFRQPHQSPNLEFRLKVSWHGEPLSSETRQIFTLAEGWPRRSKCIAIATGASRSVEATVSWWPSRPNKSCPAVIFQALFGCPDWGFTVIFLTCKLNARA